MALLFAVLLYTALAAAVLHYWMLHAPIEHEKRELGTKLRELSDLDTSDIDQLLEQLRET